LYTKRKLEEIYKRWNAKKVAERQQSKPAQPATAPANSQKQETAKPAFQNNSPKSTPQISSNQPFKKKDEPAKPVDDDMLKQLAMKFGKGL
jgi:DNA polymerase-3 subunit epsilon